MPLMTEPTLDGMEDNEWVLWYATELRHGGIRRGRSMYLPSPAEIEARKVDVHMLVKLGFDSAFVASVMQYDMPHIDRVKRLLKLYGPEETYRRCQPFLHRSEYTNDNA